LRNFWRACAPSQEAREAPTCPPAEAKIQIEGLTIDLKSRRAFVDNADMHLTRTEFALLATLARNGDAVLTHDELLARVWGEEYRGSSHYLHVYLGRIRKKMSDKYSPLLETVAGMGYLLHLSPLIWFKASTTWMPRSAQGSASAVIPSG
jgi:DNA-binding response OmpR family regulator